MILAKCGAHFSIVWGRLGSNHAPLGSFWGSGGKLLGRSGQFTNLKNTANEPSQISHFSAKSVTSGLGQMWRIFLHNWGYGLGGSCDATQDLHASTPKAGRRFLADNTFVEQLNICRQHIRKLKNHFCTHHLNTNV